VWLELSLLVEMVDKDIYYQRISNHLLHSLVCLMLAQVVAVGVVELFLDQQELEELGQETDQKVMLFQEMVFHSDQVVEDQHRTLQVKAGKQVVLASLA
jgi:hypothetical protein